MSFYLAIVSPTDSPLFELSLSSSKPLVPPQTSSAASSASTFPSWSTFTAPNGADLADNANKLKGQLLETKGQPERDRAMCQMVANMSLDSVEETMETTGALYLKNVDRHNEWVVSAFLPTTGMSRAVKFILLHDVKNDDAIRQFFISLWECYVKILLSPFHTVNTPIRSPAFEARVRQIAKKYL
nr:hypothetical protein L203_00933 [Cryptococcus depauperatus CBS 7841]